MLKNGLIPANSDLRRYETCLVIRAGSIINAALGVKFRKEPKANEDDGENPSQPIVRTDIVEQK